MVDVLGVLTGLVLLAFFAELLFLCVTATYLIITKTFEWRTARTLEVGDN